MSFLRRDILPQPGRSQRSRNEIFSVDLQQTVRELLAKQDVWDYTVSSARDPYDADFKLRGAFLLQFKTPTQERVPYLVLNYLGASCKSCVEYACHLENRTHAVFIDVIDELGAAAEELLDTWFPSGETWLDTLPLE